MDASTPTIRLLADPGLPQRVAHQIVDDVAERTSREVGQEWDVEVIEETLPLGPDGQVHLDEHVAELRRHEEDYVVYLTDLPRYVDEQPMLCTVSPQARAALISMPPFGGVRLTARTRDLMMTLIHRAKGRAAGHPPASAVQDAMGGVKLREVPAPEGDSSMTVLTGRFAALRMLSGMVRSNGPGGMLPAMKGSIAAGVATGAFGVFYGTIAPLADALSSLRMVLISLLVIGALSAWLIISNNLWNRGRGREESGAGQRSLDNASTAITVGVSVLLMYLVLVAVLLALTLAVIESGYLESQVMRPVGFGQYFDLAWLAASLGTMAGALGSSFDSDEAVRKATYSRRYHERRKLFDTYDEQEEDR